MKQNCALQIIKQIVHKLQCAIGVHHIELIFLDIRLDFILMLGEGLIHILERAEAVDTVAYVDEICVVVLLLPHLQIGAAGIVLRHLHAGIHVMAIFGPYKVNGTQFYHLRLGRQPESTCAAAIGLLYLPTYEHFLIVVDVHHLAEAAFAIHHLAFGYVDGVHLIGIGKLHHHIALHIEHHLIVGIIIHLESVFLPCFVEHERIGEVVEEIDALKLLRHASGTHHQCK